MIAGLLLLAAEWVAVAGVLLCAAGLVSGVVRAVRAWREGAP